MSSWHFALPKRSDGQPDLGAKPLLVNCDLCFGEDNYDPEEPHYWVEMDTFKLTEVVKCAVCAKEA